jgi:uncharacterized protein
MSENIQKYRFLKNILPVPSSRKLVLLTGARQTGKTTLSLDKYPHLRHINLDAPEDRETLRNISSTSWGKDIGNAVLDEAQKEPIVFDKIKFAFDRKDISFSVILGSSQILLLKKIRESLAGRISLYELWPLMMSEIFRDEESKSTHLPFINYLLASDKLDKIMKKVPSVLTEMEDNPRRLAEEYLLQWGGMPALLTLTAEERWKWLKDYEYTYLERDLADLARLSDLSPFRKFQKLAALRSARLLNYSELARDASLSVDTAKRYMEYLRISYQTVLLQPYYKNITSSVVKTPKIYWTDIGLLRHLSGFRGELTGEIYETMVVGELFKWIKTTQSDAELYFYRSRSGLEVDVLVETGAGITGMEIKARKTIAPKDITPMKEVAGALGKKWRGGIVVYAGNEIKKIADPQIWAIPSRRLFI